MRDEFKVHQLNDRGLKKAADLGEVFSRALDVVEVTKLQAQKLKEMPE